MAQPTQGEGLTEQTTRWPLPPAYQQLAGRLEPWRLAVYPAVLVVALLVATVVLSVTPAETREAQGLRLGGDWPSFHAAGEVVATDGAAGLVKVYDWEVQRALQAPHVLPADRGTIIPFPYPPWVAVAVSPLSWLGYVAGFWLYTVLSLGAVAASVAALGTRFERVRVHRSAALACALAFAPLARGVFGGQNTAWTLLVGAVLVSGVGGELAAAVMVGLLWSKPQLAAVVALLLVLTGRWRAAVGSLAVPIAASAGLTAWAGTAWMGAWTDGLLAFRAADQQVDLGHGLTVWQLAEPLLGSLPAGVLACGVGAVAWALVGWMATAHREAVVPLGLACLPALVPHLGFYDAGVLVLPLLWWAAVAGRMAVPAAGGVALVALPAAFADPPLPLLLAGVHAMVAAGTVWVARHRPAHGD